MEIFLDGQPIGETRLGRALVIENLSVGAHRVRARRDGYKIWEGDK